MTGFKPFKRFHIDQAAKFKTYLSQAKNQRGQPLSHSTVDALNRLQSAAPLEFSVEPDVRRGAARMGRSFERDAMYENAFNKIEQKLRTEEGIANELYYVGLVAV
jgi:hypothetical protein